MGNNKVVLYVTHTTYIFIGHAQNGINSVRALFLSLSYADKTRLIRIFPHGNGNAKKKKLRERKKNLKWKVRGKRLHAL